MKNFDLLISFDYKQSIFSGIDVNESEEYISSIAAFISQNCSGKLTAVIEPAERVLDLTFNDKTISLSGSYAFEGLQMGVNTPDLTLALSALALLDFLGLKFEFMVRFANKVEKLDLQDDAFLDQISISTQGRSRKLIVDFLTNFGLRRNFNLQIALSDYDF